MQGLSEYLAAMNTGGVYPARCSGMDDPNADAAVLVWDQAKQQLAAQSASLDLLRTRTTAMLSVATLVAGLFATRLPSDKTHLQGRVLGFVIAALALFGLSAVLAILAVAPRDGWVFAFDLDDLLASIREGDTVPVDVTANLARAATAAYKANTVKLHGLYRLFGAVCFLVALQVIAWGIAAL